MADIEGVDERVEMDWREYRVDWWYDKQKDEIVIEYATDDYGEPISPTGNKALSLKSILYKRHIK